MSGFAKALEKACLILRNSDPHDERVKNLVRTLEVQAVLNAIKVKKDATLAVMLNGFSEDEKRDLFKKAPRIICNGS